MSRQPKRYARLEVFPDWRSSAGWRRQWFVRLRYSNGGIAMTSEGYSSHSKAVRAARSIRRGIDPSLRTLEIREANR